MRHILLLCVVAVLFAQALVHAQAPQLTAHTPERYAASVSTAATVSFTFSTAMSTATITAGSVVVRGSLTGERYLTSASQIAFSNGNATVTVTPNKPFKPGELVTVQLLNTIASTSGTTLTTSATWHFRTVGSGAGQREFYHREVFANPSACYAVRVGDFNGDGYVDFVASMRSSELYVYINNGNRTFSHSTTISLASDAYDVEVSDFNNDGALDIIHGVVASNILYLYMGTGGGTFAAPVTTASVDRVLSIQADDFDGDGNTDLATAAETSQGIAWLTGDGVGSVSTAYSGNLYNMFARPLAIADFDGNYTADLASMSFGRFAVLYGDGAGATTGSVTNVISNGAANNIEPVDVDSDGDLDAVLGFDDSGFAQGFELMTNNGDGSFSAGSLPNSFNNVFFQSARALDFDSDGDVDLVMLYTQGKIAVAYNDGTGDFGSQQEIAEYSASWAKNIELADFDRDGAVDVLVFDREKTAESISVFYNDTVRTLAFSVTSATLPATDLNIATTLTLTLQHRGLTTAIAIVSNNPAVELSTDNTVFSSSTTISAPAGNTSPVYVRYLPTQPVLTTAIVTAQTALSTSSTLVGTVTLSGTPNIPDGLVTNTSDSGPGSLRSVLENATSGTVVQFSSDLATRTFHVTSGSIVISHRLSLDFHGAGGDVTIVSAVGPALVFECAAQGSVLTGVRIFTLDGSAGSVSNCPSLRVIQAKEAIDPG